MWKMKRGVRARMPARSVYAHYRDSAARRAESKLQALIAAWPGCLAYLDLQFEYQYTSPDYSRRCVSAPADLIGRNHFSLFPNPSMEDIFRRIVEDGLAFESQSAPYFLARGPQYSARTPWSVIPARSSPDGPVEGLIIQIESAASQDGSILSLLYGSPDASLLLDGVGRITAANLPAEILFGYSLSELIGAPLHQIVAGIPVITAGPGQDQAGIPHTDPSAAVLDRRIEAVAQQKAGSPFPIEVTFTSIDDHQTYCLIRDLRTRQAHERELQMQTEMVRLLRDIASAANESGSVREAFHYALERLCGYLDWPVGHAFLTEEDAALSSTQIWIGADGNQFAAFRAISDELRYRPGMGLPGQALGSARPVWMNDLLDHPQFLRPREAERAGLRTGLALPVLAEQKVVGVLEFFHTHSIFPDPALLDVLPLIGVQLGRVVERQRAEDTLRKSAAQMRMVMTNLPVILWVTNREGRLIMLEGKGVTSTGLEPEKLLGKIVFDMIQDQPRLLDLTERALQGNEIHTEIHSSEGAIFELFYTPYYDVNWAVDGAIGLAFDITQRKRMEAELEEVKHHLLDSIESERTRLAQQLHDGPLQDLYGAFYQIQEIKNSLPEEGQSTANRALSTIQSVNATLRVICGELHPNTLVHLGLQQAIRSHAERLQERLDSTSLHLNLAVEQQPLPHPLRLGMYRIYQQLVNNAVQHAQAQHIWVRLNIHPSQVSLEVQDNGQGFDLPEHWIELVRKGKYGLVSTVERVQSLNGSIEIHSRPHQGTTVRVKVPV